MNDHVLVGKSADAATDWLPPEAPLSMPPQVLSRRGPRRLSLLMRLLFGWQSA